MPTYQYRCADCGRELEVVQKFTDDALTECPTCTGTLRKVFNAVGVVFKGSGFYATDNRTKGKQDAAKPAAASSSDAAGSGSGTADKPAASSAPAPSKPSSKDPAA
ncbi:MAG: zinc ribbon domain-containing protein [Propionibacteriaceae bacterium]|nr:zinc ribbon domain-containing protein [Propionibacteriaceae bacterium]